MIETFLHSALAGNRIQSIQVHLGVDQKEYELIEVQKKKDNLLITDRFSTTDLEVFTKRLSKNKPALLSITGQGVISKKVDDTANYQSKILFNADPDDFFWYEYHQNNERFVSVARKELIEKDIEAFSSNQVSIIDISIGPFVTTAIMPLLPTDIIHTREFELDFTNDQLHNFKKIAVGKEERYTIGDEVLSNKEIISFSNVIHHFYPGESMVSDRSFLSSNKEEFVYKKAFNFLGIFLLSFFLVSLLISYLLLSHYQQANQKVMVELGQQNVAYTKLVSLEKDKENKEAILKESGVSDSNFLSFYISEITKEIPSEINIKTLNIFPTTTKIKPEQRINFINNRIEVKGTVTSYSAFSNWIKELKKQPWVGNLEILDFQRENRTNSFEINIIVKLDV